MSESLARGHRGYLPAAHGQLHYRATGLGSATAPCLICLHPTPFSSRFYAGFMAVAEDVDVLALDTPGFGESDPLSNVTIESLAEAIVSGLETLPGPSDVLGFHAGAIIGLELAARFPRRVRRLVLVDAPYFPPEARAEVLERTLAAFAIRPDRYAGLLAKRVPPPPDRPTARDLELLADEIAGSTAAVATFRAVFSYAAEDRLARITQPTLCIATHGNLAQPTRTLARALPAARLIELSQVAAPVFERHAAAVAAAVVPFVLAQ